MPEDEKKPSQERPKDPPKPEIIDLTPTTIQKEDRTKKTTRIIQDIAKKSDTL